MTNSDEISTILPRGLNYLAELISYYWLSRFESSPRTIKKITNLYDFRCNFSFFLKINSNATNNGQIMGSRHLSPNYYGPNPSPQVHDRIRAYAKSGDASPTWEQCNWRAWDPTKETLTISTNSY